MAYREPARVLEARFELRSPIAFRVIGMLLVGLAASAVALLAWGTAARGAAPPIVYGLVGVLQVVVIVWWRASNPCRIAGGKGVLLVYNDLVEIPGTWRKQVIRLPRIDLVYDVKPRSNAFQRGLLITLRNGTTERVLSTLTSPNHGFAGELAWALSRPLKEGELPPKAMATLDSLAQQMLSPPR